MTEENKPRRWPIHVAQSLYQMVRSAPGVILLDTNDNMRRQYATPAGPNFVPKDTIDVQCTDCGQPAAVQRTVGKASVKDLGESIMDLIRQGYVPLARGASSYTTAIVRAYEFMEKPADASRVVIDFTRFEPANAYK